MIRPLSLIVVSCTCSLLLSGCPELLVGTNVTGFYAGSWRIPAEGEAEEAESCPMTLELLHIPNADNVADATKVTGYITLDFTCFDVLNSILLLQEIEVGEIEVVGYSISGGNIFLRSVDIVRGCNGDLCISLILTGQAVDDDGDGMADTLSGEWSALFPFPESGAFEAAINTEM